MGCAEFCVSLLGEIDSFLVLKRGCGLIPKSFQSESEAVVSLHEILIEGNCSLETRFCLRPAVLNRVKLPQIVLKLSRFRVVPDTLLELDLCRIEAAYHHEVAPENLVRFRVLHV